MFLNLDNTLLAFTAIRKGESFNFHYQTHEYHPLLCYSDFTGDLLRAELRESTLHCSNDTNKFMEPSFKNMWKEVLKLIFVMTVDSQILSFIKPIR